MASIITQQIKRLTSKVTLWHLILAGILVLAFILRVHQYHRFPIAGETKDEYAWTWLGTSLVTGQPPTSWTWFDHYDTCFDSKLTNESFQLCTPVFDHPPLFSLIPGTAFALVSGEIGQLPSIKVIRFPMVILGTINVFLIYLASKAWYNKKTALTAAALYATIPTFVFSSRMVLSENFLITLMLLAMYYLKSSPKPSKSQYKAIAAISLLAVLTKTAGVFIPLAIAVSSFFHGQKKLLKASLLGAGTGIIVWFIYGAAFNFELFINSLTAQSGLDVGWFSFLALFYKPFLVERHFLDAWLPLGWLSLFGYLLYSQKEKLTRNPLTWFFGTWLLFYLLTTGMTTYHAWYRYPMFPLMAIAMANILRQNRSHISLTLLVLFVLIPNLHFISPDLFLIANPLWFRGMIVVSLGLGLVFQKYPHLLKLKWAKLASLILLILINSWIILALDPLIVENDMLKFFPVVNI